MRKVSLSLFLLPLLIALAWQPEWRLPTFPSPSEAPPARKPFLRPSAPLELPEAQIAAWLRSELGAGPETNFVLRRRYTDRLGIEHLRYAQTYRDLPVQDGILMVHRRGQTLLSANGEFYPGVDLVPTVRLEPGVAMERAKVALGPVDWAWADAEFPEPELRIVRTEAGYRCAYKIELFAQEPLIRKWLFVDPVDGAIVAERDQLTHLTVPGVAECFHHGRQTIWVDSLAPNEFVLRDFSRGADVITLDLNGSSDFSSAVDFVDTDNFWDTTTDLDNAAYDVHWAVGLMYDYFLEVHGWDSYDNQGSALVSHVHHSNRFNASWNGSSFQFGDGDGNFFKPLTAMEVVGHELMHAYTSTVGWNNSNFETASLNEAYSDIFSVILEFNLNPGTANYFIGDMVTVSGEALRNMEDPKSIDHPDTYQGQFWSSTDINANSEILNHCFYLLTQGGGGTNDNGDAYTVEPLLMSEVADILFRTMTVYLPPASTFADVRRFGIQSCIDLYGPCSGQEIQFTNACYAVGLGAAYAGPPLTTIEWTGDTSVEVDLAFSSNATMASTWAWDFGDGNTSVEESPIHRYQSPGTYSVRLSASYPANCVQSDTLLIDIAPLTALREPETGQPSVFPNPARGQLFVTLASEAALRRIRLFDVRGQYLATVPHRPTASDTYALDLTSWPAGIYLLEMRTPTGEVFYHRCYLGR